MVHILHLVDTSLEFLKTLKKFPNPFFQVILIINLIFGRKSTKIVQRASIHATGKAQFPLLLTSYTKYFIYYS